jgi:hypothetical protein
VYSADDFIDADPMFPFSAEGEDSCANADAFNAEPIFSPTVRTESMDTVRQAPPARPPPPKQAPKSLAPSDAVSESSPQPEDVASKPGVTATKVKLEPLLPEQVRWYYCQKKGSVVEQQPFCTHDSVKLELRYRELIQAGHTKQTPAQGFNKKDHVVMVRGNAYDVDVMSRVMRSAYWKEKFAAVVRGTWFRPSSSGHVVTPCDEHMADELERIYMSGIWYRPNWPEAITPNNKPPPMFRTHIHHSPYTALWYPMGRVELKGYLRMFSSASASFHFLSFLFLLVDIAIFQEF